MVSVIIPVYNAERYIRDTLNSVLNQSYQELDIIIINDGSTDDSLLVCQEYVRNDNRIRLFNQDNKGPSSARNIGLLEARGRYILFIDSDDYILPSHISSLVNTIEQYNTDICVSNCKEICEMNFNYNQYVQQEDIIYTLRPEELLKEVIYGKKFGWEVAAKLYKKSILSGVFFDEKEMLAEDFTFFYKSLNKCQSASVCLNDTYLYIKRDSSITANNETYLGDKLINVSMNFSKHIDMNYPGLKYYADLFQFYVYIGILGRYALNDDEATFFHKKNEYMPFIKRFIFKVLLDKDIKNKFKLKTILILISRKIYNFFMHLYMARHT